MSSELEIDLSKMTQEIVLPDSEPTLFNGIVKLHELDQRIMITNTNGSVFNVYSSDEPKEFPEYEFLMGYIGKPMQLLVSENKISFIFSEDGDQKIKTFKRRRVIKTTTND